MRKATREEAEHFENVTKGAPYSMALSSEKNKITLIEIGDIPPVDNKGRRDGVGFEMQWSAIVDPLWTNFVGNLHGAAVAWIVDTCTSAAIVPLHTESWWGPPMLAGVSLNINVDYLHPTPAGMKIRIIAKIIRLTPTLANINCEIRDFETDKLLSTATHLKTWRPGPKSRESKL